MELPSKVDDVIFGEACGREAVKATQRLDLRLLCTSYGGMRCISSCADRQDSQIRGMMADMKQLQCCAAHLRLCLAVLLTIGELRADRAV